MKTNEFQKKHIKQFNEYTELRMQENRLLDLSFTNGSLISSIKKSTSGISARVYKNGVWGFASSCGMGKSSMDYVVGTALRNAKFLSLRQKNEKTINYLWNCIAFISDGSPCLPSIL